MALVGMLQICSSPRHTKDRVIFMVGPMILTYIRMLTGHSVDPWSCHYGNAGILLKNLDEFISMTLSISSTVIGVCLEMLK